MARKKQMAVVAQLVMMTSLIREVRGSWEEDVASRLDNLELASTSLIRQTILQQFSQEEARRSDGDSGLKQIRAMADGTRAYYTATHSSHATAAIHDHTDNIRTCGMGEIEAVLNGIHFRTRHNDYGLYKPSSTSGDYHATEAIPLPDVPPAVLNAGGVVEQIREMRAWFRAWQDQNSTVRDYRPYFKPLLCYLEGAWTNNEKIDEPFESTRHHLDAKSWFDLQEKVRFTAYTGDKDQSENFAFLPTAIFNISDGAPVLGQWNYRILCHPVQDGLLDLQHLRPVDDLSTRLRIRRNMDDYLKTRAARYFITQHVTDRADVNGLTLLDRLMAQIPGKDNYMGNIQDSALGRIKFDHFDETKVLNSAFYHRWYKIGESSLRLCGRINYLLTPVEFFNGGEVDPNPADTVRGAVGVLDRNGDVRTVSESGIRIFLPEIVDVPGGNIRTRYPVFPVYAEGGTAYKEVEALQQIVMDLQAYSGYLHSQPNFGSGTPPPSTESPWYTLVMSSSDASAGVHVHHVELQTEQALSVINDGEFVSIRTTLANAHSHLLNITFNPTSQQFYYIRCDNREENVLCRDGHAQPLYRED